MPLFGPRGCSSGTIGIGYFRVAETRDIGSVLSRALGGDEKWRRGAQGALPRRRASALEVVEAFDDSGLLTRIRTIHAPKESRAPFDFVTPPHSGKWLHASATLCVLRPRETDPWESEGAPSNMDRNCLGLLN
jgi:hypothetical protein